MWYKDDGVNSISTGEDQSTAPSKKVTSHVFEKLSGMLVASMLLRLMRRFPCIAVTPVTPGTQAMTPQKPKHVDIVTSSLPASCRHVVEPTFAHPLWTSMEKLREVKAIWPSATICARCERKGLRLAAALDAKQRRVSFAL